jgi:hypothetical protein
VAVHVVLELLVQLGHGLAEALELRQDQVVPHDLGDERRVAGDDGLELLEVLKTGAPTTS